MFGNNGYSAQNQGEITREIKRRCGQLSGSGRGWTKQVNIISWNGGEDKLDIRDWNEDMTRCGKGISLTEAEAAELYKILRKMYEGR